MDNLIKNNIQILQNLTIPKGRIDIIIDSSPMSDANQISALTYALINSERFCIKALYSSTNQVNSAQAHAIAISNLLSLFNKSDSIEVFKGAKKKIDIENGYSESDSVEHLASIINNYTENNPIYIICLGPLTNIASALNKYSSIKNRVVIIWVGSHSFWWHNQLEENQQFDYYATKTILDMRIPLILFPKNGICSNLTISKCELNNCLKHDSDIVKNIYNIIENQLSTKTSTASLSFSCVVPFIWLIDDSKATSMIKSSPVLTPQFQFLEESTRHFIRCITSINRDEMVWDIINYFNQT